MDVLMLAIPGTDHRVYVHYETHAYVTERAARQAWEHIERQRIPDVGATRHRLPADRAGRFVTYMAFGAPAWERTAAKLTPGLPIEPPAPLVKELVARRIALTVAGVPNYRAEGMS